MRTKNKASRLADFIDAMDKKWERKYSNHDKRLSEDKLILSQESEYLAKYM